MLSRLLSAAVFAVLLASGNAALAVVAAPATLTVDVYNGDPAAPESTWTRLGGTTVSAEVSPDGTFSVNPADTIGSGFALLNLALAGDVDPFITYGFDARNDSAVTQIYSFSFGTVLSPIVSVANTVSATLSAFLQSGDGPSAVNPAAAGFVQRVRLSNDGGVSALIDVPGVALGGPLAADDAGFASYALGPVSVSGPVGNWDYLEIFGRFTLSGGGAGGDVVAFAGRAEILPIPEPRTWAFLLLGVGALVVYGQRRRQRRPFFSSAW